MFIKILLASEIKLWDFLEVLKIKDKLIFSLLLLAMEF
jgi:hypothetical protein